MIIYLTCSFSTVLISHCSCFHRFFLLFLHIVKNFQRKIAIFSAPSYWNLKFWSNENTYLSDISFSWLVESLVFMFGCRPTKLFLITKIPNFYTIGFFHPSGLLCTLLCLSPGEVPVDLFLFIVVQSFDSFSWFITQQALGTGTYLLSYTHSNLWVMNGNEEILFLIN